jgi:hypothetical protein
MKTLSLKERKAILDYASKVVVSENKKMDEGSLKERVFAQLVSNQKDAKHEGRSGEFFEKTFQDVNAEILDAKEEDIKESKENLKEATLSGNIAGYTPVMIQMLRRTVVDSISFEIIGVQPMAQPTGYIFSYVPRYGSGAQDGHEAFKTEPNSAFTGTGTQTGTNPSVLNDAVPGPYTAGDGMSTAALEALETGVNDWAEMKFTIERASVEAKGRGVRAEYSEEMITDLKNLHGLDAGMLLADLLSQEVVVEQNREIVRKIYISALPGAQEGTTTAGIWNLDNDSKGRWVDENVKSFVTQINRESSSIFQSIRMGRGNFGITTLDLSDALAILPQFRPTSVTADGTASLTGMLGDKKIIVDPYLSDIADGVFLSGYKGSNELKAGMFFTPYVGMQYYDAVHSESFQPTKGVKSRYGLIANPFATATATTQGDGTIAANTNQFFRRLKVEAVF